MKKTLAVLVFAALSSMTAFAAEWTGVISDANCGAKHLNASAADIACAQKCVKGGAAAVFVTSDSQVLKIDAGSTPKVMKLVGQKVTIKGTVEGDTVKIDSIKKI